MSLRPEGPNEESGGHRAVALAAGYLDPKRDELVRALRKQVCSQSLSLIEFKRPASLTFMYANSGRTRPTPTS